MAASWCSLKRAWISWLVLVVLVSVSGVSLMTVGDVKVWEVTLILF